MNCLGHFWSLDSAVRFYIKHDSSNWSISPCGRFLTHEGGLKLVNQVNSIGWTLCEPVGYIKLSKITDALIWLALKFSRSPISSDK